MTQKPADDRASYLYGRAPDPTVDRRYRPCPDMRVNLYQNMIEEDEEESTTDCVSSPAEAGAAAVRCTSNSSASSGASGDDSNAVVVLRLRPTAKMCADFSFERNIFKHRIANTTDCSQAKIPEKHFTFGSIFPETTSQSEVYQTCVYDAIENEDALTVLTYGTSGSGKTFTLLGIHSGNPGIIPRAIEHIFRRFGRQVSSVPVVKVVRGAVVAVPDDRARTEAALRHALIGKKATASAAASNVERSAEAYAQHQEHIQKEHSFRAIEKASNECVVVWVSFAELYNENVYDLLPTPPASNSHHQKENHHPNHHHHNHHQQQQQPRKTLKVISNDGNVFIKDLNSVHCRSALDAYQLLAAGLANITYATTNINQNSSRSHCVFFVDVIKLTGGCEFQHIAYKFCDLAGSERLKKTDNVGNRLKEAQSINNSLMVLGRCLDAVYHKQSIVPIRDSKLTVLLQASLLGREKIKMIVNMRPSVEYLEENLNVLNFASMAKQIVYKPPTQQELHKRNRNTARFSWFIEHAALSSSPVHKKKPTAAAAAASNGDGNENYANMGNDTQISLLLDDNGLLKMENEDLQLQLDELRGSIEQRELQIRREMIEEFDEREKRSTELWKKRLAFVEQTAKSNAMQSKLEISKWEAKYKRVLEQLEQREDIRSSACVEAQAEPVLAEEVDELEQQQDACGMTETAENSGPMANSRSSSAALVLDLTGESSNCSDSSSSDEGDDDEHDFWGDTTLDLNGDTTLDLNGGETEVVRQPDPLERSPVPAESPVEPVAGASNGVSDEPPVKRNRTNE